MSAIARPRSQVLIFMGTVGLALAAGICNSSAIMPGSYRPEGMIQYVLLVLVVAAAASVFAWTGNRLLNRPSAALLGAVGGGFAAALVNPAVGALGGFGVGLVIGLDWVGQAALMATTLAVGLAGVGLASHVYLNGGPAWAWTSVVIGIVTMAIQLWLCWITLRKATTNSPSWRWRRFTATAACLGTLCLILVTSWVGGWYGEMYLRIRAIEERGGRIYFEWFGRRPLPTGANVSLHNPRIRDWRTVGTLPSVSGFSLSGLETDDTALAEMPVMPRVWHLSISESNLTGSFLSKRPLPDVGVITVRQTPFDDDAMAHLGQLPGLVRLELLETNVTGKGLAQLKGAPLRLLRISGERLRNSDLQGLEGLMVSHLYLDCPNVNSHGFKHLMKVPLQYLLLSSPICDAEIRELQTLKNLVGLTVYLSEVTSETLAELSRFPNTCALTIHIPHEYATKIPDWEQRLPSARIYSYGENLRTGHH